MRRRRSAVSLQELETKVRKVFSEGIPLVESTCWRFHIEESVNTLCKMGVNPLTGMGSLVIA